MPVFATGHNDAYGWYHLSMVNIESGTWRIWVRLGYLVMVRAGPSIDIPVSRLT